MLTVFKIYIDRLKSEPEEKIKEILPPFFIEVDEKELKFSNPIHFEGKAYIADEYLIVHLKVKVIYEMPCAICNEMKEFTMQLDPLYITKKLDEIKGAVYDFSSSLQEAILLEIPQFAECNQGKCPEREEINVYLKKEPSKKDNLPFKDIQE